VSASDRDLDVRRCLGRAGHDSKYDWAGRLRVWRPRGCRNARAQNKLKASNDVMMVIAGSGGNDASG
jgi:hypothetical protein